MLSAVKHRTNILLTFKSVRIPYLLAPHSNVLTFFELFFVLTKGDSFNLNFPFLREGNEG